MGEREGKDVCMACMQAYVQMRAQADACKYVHAGVGVRACGRGCVGVC